MSQDPRWTAKTHNHAAREIGYFLLQEGATTRVDDFADHILAALAEAGLLIPSGSETRREGICGAEHPKLFVNCAATFPVICVLRHGHDSAWHEGDTGERWRPRLLPATGGPQGDEQAAPRVWAMPSIPADVVGLTDHYGVRWKRHNGGGPWSTWCHVDDVWSNLDEAELFRRGPLTEVDGSQT